MEKKMIRSSENVRPRVVAKHGETTEIIKTEGGKTKKIIKRIVKKVKTSSGEIKKPETKDVKPPAKTTVEDDEKSRKIVKKIIKKTTPSPGEIKKPETKDVKPPEKKPEIKKETGEIKKKIPDKTEPPQVVKPIASVVSAPEEKIETGVSWFEIKDATLEKLLGFVNVDKLMPLMDRVFSKVELTGKLKKAGFKPEEIDVILSHAREDVSIKKITFDEKPAPPIPADKQIKKDFSSAISTITQKIDKTVPEEKDKKGIFSKYGTTKKIDKEVPVPEEKKDVFSRYGITKKIDKEEAVPEEKKDFFAPASVSTKKFEEEDTCIETQRLTGGARAEFVDKCLKKIIDLGGSDLHLSTGQQPMFRCRGDLKNLDMPVFRKELSADLINLILSREERKELENKLSVDFMYVMESDKGPPHRFRSNAYYHRTGFNMVMRIIPNKIPTIEELGLPDIVAAFGRFFQGLVLVTGSSGSGKSSTLTALIDLINNERNANIITIENPIEFIHKPKRCIVRQRQVGVHTKNYNRALKASIREDPDVILVSELRDLETIQLAMTAAETGCLVLSTMSTTNAARTIDRIIDSFPPEQRLQAGAMLSESLKVIISQQLVPSIDRSKRYAVSEILIGCTPLTSLIREQKTFQIPSLIETSKGVGMQSMDSSLLNLLEQGLINHEVALESALDKTIIMDFIKKAEGQKVN